MCMLLCACVLLCVYVCVVFSSVFVCKHVCVCVRAVVMAGFILVRCPGVTTGRTAYCQYTYMHIIYIYGSLVAWIVKNRSVYLLTQLHVALNSK